MSGTLTPIKVPGKRKAQPQLSTAEAARKSVQKAPKWIGRPFKQIAVSATSSRSSSRSSSPPTPSTPRRPRSMKHMKSKRAMSALERLPTEILQKVFLFAMNFDMPRASPILAGKLSSEYVYVETILAAFGPTWKERYDGIRNGERDPHSRVRPDIGGCPRTQSALLRCRWASLEVLRRAEALWLTRAASAEKNEFREGMADPDNPEEWLTPADIYHKAALGNDDIIHEWSMIRWTNAVEDKLFEADYELFLNSRMKSDTQMDMWSRSPKKVEMPCHLRRWPWKGMSCWEFYGFLRIHPDTDIPESLLRGPWTDDMAKHLFWLIRAGGRIRWMGSTSGEVADDGLKVAAQQGNLEVLLMFECLGLSEPLDQECLKNIFNSGEGDQLAVFTHLMVKTSDPFGDTDDSSKTWQSLLRTILAESKNDRARLALAKRLSQRWKLVRKFRSDDGGSDLPDPWGFLYD